MPSTFNIFGQLQKEIEDFNTKQLYIAGKSNDESARYLNKKSKGYRFSQKDTLDLIELYYNSKFESGPLDSEGQRKLFLNICAFRSDVAAKMVDIDTKDFVFIPDDDSSIWGSFFVGKEFKKWARDTYFGEFLNDLVENYPRYGTLVVKKVGKELERVPLKNLMNQQDAKTLATASYVIEAHEDMRADEMERYPGWDSKQLGLGVNDTATIYERYGRVPASFYYKYIGKEYNGEESESYDCVAVLTLKKADDPEKAEGSILFLEKIDSRPYLECHWKRQDGRWLGIGEVENQLENQVARNVFANLRRRSLYWASKKIFQSSDESVAKNLVAEVKDGQILKIAPNGNITQIDTASREIGEFQSTEEVWEKNSDAKSFTYDVATGESMPSGTPFRLGVMLSGAVDSHFGLKKEKLGIFLKKIVVEFIYDIFKQEISVEHTLTVFGTEDGMNILRQAAAEAEFNKRVFAWAMDKNNKEVPNFQEWKSQIEASYQMKAHLFVTIEKNYYDTIKNHVELTITGEEIDTKAKIETYTTLYQSLMKAGDPRAEKVLGKILQLTGDNLEAVAGVKPPPAANQPPAGTMQLPNIPAKQEQPV